MKDPALAAVEQLGTATVRGIAELATAEGVAIGDPDIIATAWLLGLRLGLACGVTDVAAARRLLTVIAREMDRSDESDVIAAWSRTLLAEALR